jgi:dihydroxyacetone kinase
MVDSIVARLLLKPGPVVVLLNNLGGLPQIELLIVSRRVMAYLRERGIIPVRALVGTFMTALDMTGYLIH